MKSLFIIGLFFLPLYLFAQTELESGGIYDTVKVIDPLHSNSMQLSIYGHYTRDLRRIGNIVNGKREGSWRTYYQNGLLSSLQQFHEDILNGVFLIFEPGAQLAREDFYENGILEGISHAFHGGVMTSIEPYKNGQLNGWRKIFVNGIISEEGNWKMGIRDSISRWYSVIGKVSIEYYYTNGTLNGSSISYYENGQVKSSGNFLNSYQNGYWKEFYASGKLSEEGDYSSGKKNGTWSFFSEEGILQKTEQYRNGDVVKKTRVKK
ncbi:MAG: toxin-antitoxin system YwqK family antitoxin [Chitinophagales bacterium]|nr:toxin-antitoxin system YwqK family antitoxin [Chitinophagales bacterium]